MLGGLRQLGDGVEDIELDKDDDQPTPQRDILQYHAYSQVNQQVIYTKIKKVGKYNIGVL